MLTLAECLVVGCSAVVIKEETKVEICAMFSAIVQFLQRSKNKVYEMRNLR